MNPHSFSLSSIGMAKGRAQVKLDGEDISDAVSGVGLDFSAREHPRVMLELSGVSADVAVDAAEIQLPAGIVAMLQRLGWISPERAEDVEDYLMTCDEGGGSVTTDEVRRTLLGPPPVIKSDETSGEVSPDAVGRMIP